MSEPYYRDLGGKTFESTIHAQGAWNEHEQHMAPASGLLTHVIEREFATHVIEREFATDGMRVARLSFEIYGIIHAGEFTVRTQVLRPGRTIELVQAEMVCGDRVAISARAWLLATSDTEDLAGIEDTPMHPLSDAEQWDGMSPWPGGYIDSLEFRTLGTPRPGARQTWLRSQHPLIDSGDVTPLAHLVRLSDTANGLSAREHPARLLYPNVDLQIHIHRLPQGDWLGIDGIQQYGPDGVGLTSSILNDELGPFARAEQILTLRRR